VLCGWSNTHLLNLPESRIISYLGHISGLNRIRQLSSVKCNSGTNHHIQQVKVFHQAPHSLLSAAQHASRCNLTTHGITALLSQTFGAGVGPALLFAAPEGTTINPQTPIHTCRIRTSHPISTGATSGRPLPNRMHNVSLSPRSITLDPPSCLFGHRHFSFLEATYDLELHPGLSIRLLSPSLLPVARW
jgi:hypothetical protein